jgi:hypothetical protein
MIYPYLVKWGLFIAMHHSKSTIFQMQDIFVAKQHIFSKPLFQAFK